MGDGPDVQHGPEGAPSAPIETKMDPQKLGEVSGKLQAARQQREAAELKDKASDTEAQAAFKAADQAKLEAEFEKDGEPSDATLMAFIASDYFNLEDIDASQADALTALLAPGRGETPIPADLRAELVEAYGSAKEVYKEIDYRDEREVTEEIAAAEKKNRATYSEPMQAKIDKYIENAKQGLFDRQLTDFLVDRAKKAGDQPSPLDTAVIWVGTQLAQLLIADDQPASKHLASLVKPANYAKRQALEAAIGLHLVVNESTGDVFVDWVEPSGKLPQTDRAFALAKDVMGDGPAARLFDKGLTMDTTLAQLEASLKDYPESEQAKLKKLIEGIKKDAGEDSGNVKVVEYLQGHSDNLRVAIGLTPAPSAEESEETSETPESPEIAYEKALFAATGKVLTEEADQKAFAAAVASVGKGSLKEAYPEPGADGVLRTFETLRLMGDASAALKAVQDSLGTSNPELAAKVAKIDTKDAEKLAKSQTKAEKTAKKDSPSSDTNPPV